MTYIPPYGPVTQSAGFTTISITPQPGTQTTAASYSGSLNITPTSISQYGTIPNYGGTVTLTPNIAGSTVAPGWTATIYGPIQMTHAPCTDEEIILFLVGQILQGSGPSSGRTEETRKRMAESAILDARAILDSLRKIRQVTDVLGRGTDNHEQEAQAKQAP